MFITKKQSRIIAAILLLGFFALVLLFSNRSSKNITPAADPSLSPLANSTAAAQSSFVLNQFRRSESRDGKVLWEVQAKKGEYIPATQEAFLEQATMLLHHQNNSQVELNAAKARLIMSGVSLSKARVEGGVLLNYDQRLTLSTEAAEIDRETNMVWSDTPVKIEGDGMSISGNKLRVDVNSQIVNLSGGVKTMIRPKSKLKD